MHEDGKLPISGRASLFFSLSIWILISLSVSFSLSLALSRSFDLPGIILAVFMPSSSRCSHVLVRDERSDPYLYQGDRHWSVRGRKKEIRSWKDHHV
jgi:hypothetical protein